MSRIQERAKPALLPLIRGDWSGCDAENQRIIATWITMHTMVLEAADRKTSAIPERCRYIFAQQQRALYGWSFWIGRFNGIKEQRTFWHRGLGEVSESGATEYKSQITVSAFGQLIFMSFYRGPRNVNFKPAPWFDMQDISPPNRLPLKTPNFYNNDYARNLLVVSSSEAITNLFRGEPLPW